MKLEDQVVSLELAKQLKELGVKQAGLFYWLYGDRGAELRSLESLEKSDEHWIHLVERAVAFTVAELGEMFESYCFTRRVYSSARDENWLCKWQDVHGINERVLYGKTEADARAKCLVYLLENKLITIK